MKRSTKITVGVVAVLSVIAAVAIWYLYKNRKEIKAEEAKTPVFYTSEDTYGDAPIFPLRQGSKNEAVTLLQKALNSIPPMIYAPIATDGMFGPATASLLSKKLGITEVSKERYNQLVKQK